VLERLARATGGTYTRVTSAAADPAPVLRQIDGMEKKTIESQVSSHLTERFQWPLALAVAALLLHLAVGPFAPAAAEETERPARPEETGRRRAA
jgi:hypothetical protein